MFFLYRFFMWLQNLIVYSYVLQTQHECCILPSLAREECQYLTPCEKWKEKWLKAHKTENKIALTPSAFSDLWKKQ